MSTKKLKNKKKHANREVELHLLKYYIEFEKNVQWREYDILQ